MNHRLPGKKRDSAHTDICPLATLLMTALLLFPHVALHAGNATAQDSNLRTDPLRVSLITCEPGPLIYELYGHTAIRITDMRTNADLAFNYGMFDFSKPNFIMRFLRGETDYMLGVYPYDDFLEEYRLRGSKVIEQTLNLTAAEKAALLSALSENARPENRTYRYNFLYNNCTSQARDIIESCIDGTIIYPTDNRKETYRQMIHLYTSDSPWSEFGQDLLLGAEADIPITQRQKMFAPLFFEKYADEAIIRLPNGTARPLVTATTVIQPYNAMKETAGFPIPPLGVFGALLLATVLVCATELRTGKVFWGWEAMLMTVQGIAGCLVTFMFFFSEHPAVSSNWLIVLLNPIPIIYVAFRVRNIMKHKYDHYVPAALAVEALFLAAMPFIPQSFSAAVYCFTLSLCLHSASGAFLQHRFRTRQTAGASLTT